MARWLARHGARVRVADTRAAAAARARELAAELPGVALWRGAFTDATLRRRRPDRDQPGRRRRTSRRSRLRSRAASESSATSSSSRARCRPAQKVLAITGSNGKSTVTALTGAACCARRPAHRRRRQHRRCRCSMRSREHRGTAQPWPDVFVLELSSFQLETTSSLAAPTRRRCSTLAEPSRPLRRPRRLRRGEGARSSADGGAQVLNRDDALVAGDARCPAAVVQTFGCERAARRGRVGHLTRRRRTWLARGGELLMPASELALVGPAQRAQRARRARAGRRDRRARRGALLDALRAVPRPAAPPGAVAEIGGVALRRRFEGHQRRRDRAPRSTASAAASVLIAGGDGKGQDFAPLAPAVDARMRARWC